MGTLGALILLLFAGCSVDKLVSSPVDGLLMPSASAVTDSAAIGSASLRTTKIALGTSRPGTLSWRAERARNSTWLSLVRSTGNAPDTLEVLLNPAGLAAATYRDTLILSTNNSEASPVRLPIEFAVHPCRVASVAEDTLINAPLTMSECGSSRATGSFARLYEFAAVAGDSVTLELQATGFDAQLVLDTTAAANGHPPLAMATACRGATGDPCITYFRLPSTRAYYVEVNGPATPNGGTFVLLVTPPSAPAAPAGLRQLRADSTTAIPVGAVLPSQNLVITASLSDPDIVDTLRLELELRSLASPFTGTPTHVSGLVSNGGADTIVVTVGDDSSYHWRVRTADQTGRKGPWLAFGGNAETAADFTTAVPQIPAIPTAMAQLRGSDQAPIPVGGSSSARSVVFRATVTDPDPGDQLRLEIEIRPLGTAFTNTLTVQSTPVASGVVAEATLSGFTDNTSYHWQARIVDQTGRASAWTSFGGNPEANADFTIAVPATGLVFNVQPTNATAGTSITPTIEVKALDADGNTAVSFTDSVALAIGTNPGSGTLSGTIKVKAVLGIAAFPNVSINRTGTGYALVASAATLTGVTATSTPFNITPGAATQLAFTTQPSNVAAAAAITPAVVVTARDPQGNTATAFTGNVTIAIGTNPGGGALTGTATVAAVAGVATFSNLHIDKVGTGYRLTAAATGLSGATSNTFNVTAAGASVLAFTVEPTTTSAGASITPAIQVTARDPSGNTATGFTGNVTLAIAANPGGGTLGGTATVAAVAGVATFSGLSIDKVGTGYRIAATAAGLAPDTSAAFAITAAAASRLVFSVQPSSVSAGATIAPAVQVSVQDGLGNPVTSFTGTITVAIGTNPGSGTLAGALSVAAVAGTASFGDLSINKSGSGYTLDATATGLTQATSAAFTIAPATASQLAFTVQPTSTSAGGSITPAVQVTARDAFDNTVTAFTGNVTVAIGANPAAGVLSGAATVAATAGVATFNGLSINKSGNGYTLTAAATGLSGATSTAFSISAGAATQLAFTVQPSSATAAAVLSPAVQVTARDAQGNTATGFSGNITVAIGTNPGAGTLSGSNVVTPVAGVATFSNLSINKVGVGYTLTASATGVTGTTSTSFTITPGAATKIVFTVQPTDEPAGSTITPAVQVTARDAQDNTATAFTGNITVAIGTNPGSPAGVLSGTTTAAAVAGVATFGNLSINRTGVGYTLTAAATGLTGTTSSPFTIQAAPATQLAFTVQPVNSVAGGTMSAVQVTARDSLGNTATGFTGNVTVAIGNNPGGGTLSGTLTVAAAAGVATFSTLSINLVGNGYTLTASATGAGTASSSAFNITPGGATQLAFTAQPSADTAGKAMTPAVVVTARDAQGNTATGFTGNVTIAIGTNPGGGTLSGTPTVAAVAGVATFANLRINRTGTGYTLVATGVGITPTATSSAFNISPAPATLLVFTAQPTADTAGRAITPAVVVTARDSVGNTATSFTGTVTVAIGSNPGGGTLSGTTGVAAVAGVATFSTISINRTGTGYTLTAAATGLTGATSGAFNILPNTPTALFFTVQPTNTISGQAITPAVQVTARDAQGNTATQYAGPVRIAIGANPVDGALLPTSADSVNAVSGVATFANLRIDKVGIGYTLTANDGGLQGATSTAFNITPGGATQLAFTVQPSDEVAGVAMTPSVQVAARDAQGNLVPSHAGSVTLTLLSNPGAATVTGGGPVSFVSGVATFPSVSLDKVGTGYTLQAASGVLSGAVSASFNITHAPASILLFAVQPSNATAATTITPAIRVQARDAFGNNATTFTGNVSVAIANNPGGGVLSGSAVVPAVGGVATFSNLSINKSGIGYTLSASGLTTGATSAAFNITPGAASQLAFTVQPVNATAATAITPAVQVTARDAQGNTATSFTGNVTVAIGTNPSGGALSGTTTLAAAAGVASFSALNINLAGTGYTLTATATGLTGATSAAFNVTSGTAATLVFTVQPGSATAGVALNPAVQVTARDAQGNTATGFTGNVTIAIGTNPGGSTLTGTPTVAAVAGIATFPNLRLNRTGTGYTLTASATGPSSATSAAFNITPASASVLAFTVQPSDEVAGVAIAPAIQVTARDSVGNTATAFTGSITVSIAANPGGSTLSGTASVNAVAGVASFSTLRLNRTGTGYSLGAAATGLTGTTSAAFNITPAPASVLVFTVQPVTTTAGTAIIPAVQVTARDSVGNTATAFTGNITIAIGTNPSGGVLTGTTTVAAVAGVAGFSALNINLTGTGYTLVATATGLTSATSSAFNVVSSAATQLAFTVQPASATAGVAIAPAVQVTARDAQGNTVTGFTNTITIAIGTNPGGSTLGGTLSAAAVAGVATFNNLRLNRTGTGYTLTAAATSLTGATSAAFNISPAPGVTLAFTVQPSTEVAGAPLTPAVQVTARDSVGNTATSFTGNVTIAIGTNPGSGTLSGTASVAAVAGVATFGDLAINRTGTGYTLTAAATGLTGATSTAFDITAGTAATLVFTTQPSNVTAGAAITPAVVVTARDNQGNTATAFTGTVTMAIGTNPGASTLSGTLSTAATAGVATFNNLRLNRTGTGYTLTAAATGPTGATSGTFNVAPAPASVLVFTVQPSNATAGVAIAPAIQVTARDSVGNTATAFIGTITVAIGTNPGTGTLSGTAGVTAVAGVASFPALRINRTGTGYTLTAAATGVTGATSGTFNITAAPAVALVFTTQPTNGTAGAALTPAVVVTARDSLGNTATSFTSNVTIAIGTNPGGGTLTGTPTVAAVAGVASFANLRINRTGTGYTLTATDAGPTQATSNAFNIAPAPASALFFTVQPANATAGTAIAPAIQVTARDSVGNTATAFTGNVTLAIGTNPGGGTLTGGGATAAVAGVASFLAASINKTGTGYTLTAASTGLTSGTSTAFNITPGAATMLVFSAQPVATTAGATMAAVQVTAHDNQGNTATAFTGTITVAIGTNPGAGTLSGTTSVAAVAGVASFATLSINNAGVGYTLSAAATGLTGTTSGAFTISAGAATQLFFTVQPTATTAGLAINPAVQVTARDDQGNVATGFTSNVTIAIGTNPVGGAFRPGATLTVTAVAGVANFSNLRIDRVGTGYTLTATAAGGGAGAASSAAFNITPAPALRLAFTGQPSTTTAGVAINPAVVATAQDSLGNTTPTFAGNVTITIDVNPVGGSLSGTTSASAVAGVATFNNLRITKAGTGYTLLAASAGLISSGSAAFNIVPAPASQLFFTTQPSSTVAGAAIAPPVVVTARDSVGNTATGFTSTVTIAIGTNPGASTLTGTVAVAAAAGIATFTDLHLNHTGTGYTLSASATGPAGATSNTFNITAGVATQLAFTVQPANATAGAAITPAIQVTARDAQGNTATSFTANVTLAIATNPGGGTLSGTASVAAAAGVASFSGLSINLVGTGYTLTAAATGLTGTTSTGFNITPGAASVLVLTQQPTSATAGAAITPAVQVTARDPQGNTATAFTGNVTIAIGTNPGAATLTGTTTVAAVAGVATLNDLHINRTGTGYTLTASATGPSSVTSTAFNITPGAASVLAFTVQPSNATAGVAIAPAIQVTARDNQGNTATAFTGSVSLAIGTNPGGGTLSGTASVAAVAGVASFATLEINRTGTGYTLAASATGVTGATSAAFNITPGAATALVFSVQPVNTTAGAAITPSVQVTARDDQGNTATAFTANITVAIGTNAGGGTLSGTNVVAATAGVSSFAGLSINLAGTGYTLTAAATGLTGATSTAFNIAPGAASILVFTQQPTTSTAGANITPTIQVTARDNQGNTATAFTGSVTLAIGANPGGGTLSGTATQTASSGVVSFPSMSINAAGSGYTLNATATGVTGATSNAFNITPGAASVLVFTGQPSSATAGVSISPAIQVTARDNLGNTATAFTGNVSITIAANPGGGTLSGTASLAAVAGVASFADLKINRTGTGYTLAAASGGLSSATSGAFNITPGAASELVFTVQPATTTAGAAITPAVQITARDAQGNTATGFTGTVTIALGANPGGGTLTGDLSNAAVAGVASFADLHVNRTATGYTLTASATGPSTGTSATFNITPGAATNLVFTAQPGGTTAGVAINPAVQVTARDDQGNTATSFVGTVTIGIGTNPGGSTLGGAPSTAAVAGIANFPNLRLNRTGTGYTLTAAATGLTGATSTGFDVTPAPASVLAFTTPPSNAVAGVGIAPAVVVTARDSVGNTATSFTGSVTVAIGTNPGGGTLSGTNVLAATAGVATFPGLNINLVGTGYTLTATATSVTSATSSAFNITPGPASILVFTTQPSTEVAGVGITPAVVVTARDSHGNTATGFTANVTITIANNAGGGALSGTSVVAAAAGLASFPGLSINLVGTGYTLAAAATGLTGTTSSAFNITPGAPSNLAFTVAPSNATAGVGISPAVQVTARDALGNTATSFAANITVAIGTNPGGGTLSGTAVVAATAGVASFPGLSINKSGNGYTLTAAATGLTGATSTTFNIAPAAPSTIAVNGGNGQNATVNTVVTTDPSVIVRDAFANPVPNVSVTFTVAGGGGAITPASPATILTDANGVAAVTSWTLGTTAGANTLSVASGTLSGSPVIFTATGNPGAATTLAFSQQPTSATAGVGIAPAVQVTARDGFGNTATSFVQTITVAIATNPVGGTLSGSAGVAATAGVANFPGLNINVAGNGYTFSATAAGVTAATSNAFNITPGPATQLVFSQQPASTIAGVSITPTVQATARDALGNTATAFTGTVNIAIGTNPGAGTLSGDASNAAVAGVATFPGLSINKAGTGYTLTAAATGLTGATSTAFNITAAAAATIAFQAGGTTQSATVNTAVPIDPAVIVQDQFGNPVQSVNVTFTVTGGGGTIVPASPATIATGTNGIATLTSWTLGTTAGTNNNTLSVTSTGLTGSPLTFTATATPGNASVLVFTQQPTSATAGVGIAPAVQVTARDGFGNTATAFTGNITVAIGTNPPGTGTLGGTSVVAATAGVASFPGISINRTGTGYTLTAAAAGTSGATSSAFNITPGAASILVFTQQPTNTTAGASITPAVQVTARDNQGNTATAFTGNVTIAIGTNAGGGTLSGDNVVAATAGVASFGDLSINLTGTGYTLAATATSVTSATSAAFNITPGAASILVFTQQPTSETAGVGITPAVQVTARDGLGNTATAFTGTVTVAIGTNPNGGTLSGTSALAATAGVASFPGVSIDKAGTGYTLTAAATGLTGATSTAFNITAAAATTIAFQAGNGQSATVATAVATDPAVIVTDQFGNPVQGINVTFTVTGGGGTIAPASPATVGTGTNGIAALTSWTLGTTAGTNTMTAASGTLTNSPLTFTATATPGTATTLVFTQQPTNATAGVGIAPAVQVTARDAHGNTATSFTSNVTLAIGTNPGAATLLGTTVVAATAGVVAFPGVHIDKSGTGYTLTATAASVTTATSTTFNITAATPSTIAANSPTNQSATVATAVAVDPSVIVRDAFSNPVQGVSVTFTVTAGGGSISPVSPATLTTDGNGVATLTSWNVGTAAGTNNNTLSAASGSLGGSLVVFTASATAGPVSAAQSSVSAVPGVITASTGSSASTVTVTVHDQFNNPISGATVVLSSTGSNNTITQPGTTTTAGVATGSISSTFAETKTVSATANGVGITQNSAVFVQPAAVHAAHSSVVAAPTTITASAGSSQSTITVTARDQFDNPIQFATVVLAATGTGNALGQPGSTTSASGVATGTLSSTVAQPKTVSATINAVAITQTATVTVDPGTATQLAFTQQPTDATAGNAIAPPVVVTVRDALGNTVTGFVGTVTMSIANDGSPLQNALLSGTNPVTFVNGAATFSDLAIDQVGVNYTLRATSGLLSVVSAAFSILLIG